MSLAENDGTGVPLFVRDIEISLRGATSAASFPGLDHEP